MSNLDYNFLYKIVLIGDSGVGKSNILSRFSRDEFVSNSKSTIGVEFSTRLVQHDKQVIKTQLWDTAGQERYRSITSAYYRGAVGIILVYDVTNSISFENVQKWFTEIKKNNDSSVCILLIGNKTDLDQHRVVTHKQGYEFSVTNKCLFAETSALQNKNIDQAFNLLITEIYNTTSVQRSDIFVDQSIDTIYIKAEKENPKKCKCF